MVARTLGYVFVCAALFLVGVVLYRNSQKSEVPIVYTPSQILQATWLNYKDAYVQPGTYRTVDLSRGDVTTSEGQSYTMLRAVWMDDQTTFDGAWNWSKDNIQHSQDHLLSWLWGKLPGTAGSYGVLTAQNGQNSASDADVDTALALVFAYARWQKPQYLGDARALIHDIWNNEVIEVNGTPYLVADDVEKSSSSPWAAVNPSYLNPAAYRIFAQVTTDLPWMKVVDSSYSVISKSSQLPLGAQTSDGLPPDWVALNKQTGALAPLRDQGTDANYGFDALRVPFRLGLDWEWNHDPRAQALLQKFSFLQTQWDESGALATTYAHNGSVVMGSETPAMYGGSIGYFLAADPKSAAAVYDNKLLYLYDPGANAWKQPLSYYDDNWAWFGIGLYNHLLPNLAAQLPPSAYAIGTTTS